MATTVCFYILCDVFIKCVVNTVLVCVIEYTVAALWFPLGVFCGLFLCAQVEKLNSLHYTASHQPAKTTASDRHQVALVTKTHYLLRPGSTATSTRPPIGTAHGCHNLTACAVTKKSARLHRLVGMCQI